MQADDAVKGQVKPMSTQENHEGHGKCHEAESEQGSTAPAKKLDEAGFFDMHTLGPALGNMGLCAELPAGRDASKASSRCCEGR